MKNFETPETVRVRSDVGVPASTGGFGCACGIDVQIAARALGAGFRRTAAPAAGTAATPLRTWSPPIT